MSVDYRALNDCTADASWPIPNIAEMYHLVLEPSEEKPVATGVDEASLAKNRRAELNYR